MGSRSVTNGTPVSRSRLRCPDPSRSSSRCRSFPPVLRDWVGGDTCGRGASPCGLYRLFRGAVDGGRSGIGALTGQLAAGGRSSGGSVVSWPLCRRALRGDPDSPARVGRWAVGSPAVSERADGCVCAWGGRSNRSPPHHRLDAPGLPRHEPGSSCAGRARVRQCGGWWWVGVAAGVYRKSPRDAGRGLPCVCWKTVWIPLSSPPPSPLLVGIWRFGGWVEKRVAIRITMVILWLIRAAASCASLPNGGEWDT